VAAQLQERMRPFEARCNFDTRQLKKKLKKIAQPLAQIIKTVIHLRPL
jgi:hypothetical protein